MMDLREIYGEDYYKNIGARGGKGDRGNAADKGFASMNKKKHLAASSKGGQKSRRHKLRRIT